MVATSSAEKVASDVEKRGSMDGTERFRLADWLIEPSLLRVTLGRDSTKLEPKVMAVLVYLAQRPGQVVTREELEESVWAGTVVSYDALTGAIQKLRKALNDDPRRPRIIETLSKRGYRLVAPVLAVDEATPGTTTRVPGNDRRRSWLAVSLVLLVVLLAGIAYQQFSVKTETSVPAATPPDASVAVLPFVNLGASPEQDYFADGITDDLITGLAKHDELLVISRDSSFLYKDTRLESRQIADRLNVRYILQGSVRRNDRQIRINVQLLDALTNGVQWAEQYDDLLQNIYQLQDSVTQDVVTALGHTKPDTAMEPAVADDALQAYDRFLIGRQHFYLFASHDVNNRAREFFEAAIRYDPNYAQAFAMLAWTHVYDVMNGWSDDRTASLQLAIDQASKALSIREDLPVAYFVRGLAHRERGEYIPGLVDAEKAIEYDPNYAHAHMLLATLLYFAGRPEEGLERIQQAMRINPHHPYNYTFHLGQAYYILGQYDEAVRAFEEGVSSNPASERVHVWMAAAYAQTGNIDDAEWEVEQIRILNPEVSLQDIERMFPFKDTGDREHFLEGLYKAGLQPVSREMRKRSTAEKD